MSGVLEGARPPRSASSTSATTSGNSRRPTRCSQQIDAFAPDIVGFSAMSQQYSLVLRRQPVLCACDVPDLPQAIGGVHCTMVPGRRRRGRALWDWVFVGECDDAFPELVDRMRDGGDRRCRCRTRASRPLLTARCKRSSKPVGPFPDLAALPETDYELFDIDHIVTTKNGWMGLITSRGCPYKCTYCFNMEIVDLYKAEGGATKGVKEYLRHVPGRTGWSSEIGQLKERPPRIKTLIIDDDLFTLNKPYVLEFTERVQGERRRPAVRRQRARAVLRRRHGQGARRFGVHHRRSTASSRARDACARRCCGAS